MKKLILSVASFICLAGAAVEACPYCCHYYRPVEVVYVAPVVPVRRVVFLPPPRPCTSFGFNLNFLFR